MFSLPRDLPLKLLNYYPIADCVLIFYRRNYQPVAFICNGASSRPEVVQVMQVDQSNNYM